MADLTASASSTRSGYDAIIDDARRNEDHMGKNIVILSDGTGQEGGKKEGKNSNVYQLFNMLEDRTDEQIVFYDPGLGTGFRKVTGNVGGMGISHNIKEAYAFLVEHFQAGDRIYLIGFSRGAATMRSLSSIIHHFGILPRSRPKLIDQAYNIYKERSDEPLDDRAEAFVKRHHTMWTRIRFLGCYDTVAALGLPWARASAVLDRFSPFQHKFHDLKLSESVETAVQALAIDDERKTFHPVLWEPECMDHQTVHQVWFTGMHTDVGGGYSEHGLSDISLNWLTDQAVECGIRIYSDHKVKITEDATAKMHDSRGQGMKKLFRRKARSWDDERSDTPIVHRSVEVRIDAGSSLPHNDEYQPWIVEVDHSTEPWSWATP
ncbi:MAG: DUF2235 domain-containing protein [Actinomycetia bacterium]|nr:DUF2235 domain-containing protein [Actinomycetes bacterium]